MPVISRLAPLCVALVFASFALAPVPAMAQVVAVDPRVTADAARCLAIDQAQAELTAQARGGVITPEAYKQRAAELAAERKRITDAYGARNSPPARGLLAEFNRLKAAAVAEARERAAAETRAKREAAAAEQKAKREAAAAQAAAQAQARKEAADAAAAEKARAAELAENSVFADVSTVTDERLQRARDKFYRDFGLPAPTSAEVAVQQTAAVQLVRARNVPPQRTDLRPDFDQRVDALTQQRLPERQSGWYGEVFPTAAEVVAQFSNDHEKTAALELATRRLSQNTTGVRPYAVQTRLESYQAARQGLKFDFTDLKRLTEDKEFEARVFEKSLPAYAQSMRQQAAREKAAAEAEARRRYQNQLINLLTLVVLAVGAWFPVRLMRRRRYKWQRQSEADWEKQMAGTPLPKDLWWIEVPGFRYPVGLFSGRIYDKEVWTETTVTTTTTTTPGSYSGNYYTPSSTSTSTHVSSTTYHRYWLLTTEGKQTWQRYSHHEVIASVGQKLSTIWSHDQWVLIAFNHDTGTPSFPKWWTASLHRPPYWSAVGLTTLLCGAIIAAGTIGIALTAGLPSDDLGPQVDFGTKVITGVLPVFFILLLMYAGLVSTVITFRRQWHFRKTVAPRYVAFLRTYDPVIPEVTEAKTS